MSQTIKVCIDKVLSQNRLAQARKKSAAYNPENADAVAKLAAVTEWLWRPGDVLTVSFLGGEPVVRRKIEEVAHQWSEYANITFHFGIYPKAAIRIAFDSSDGSWSYIGTQALNIPRNRPTMNYGWLGPDTEDLEYQRVVLHEFGHALGCIHEHLHPDAGIPWNVQAVYAYYRQQGWTRRDVDTNLFARYEKDQTQFSFYDPTSIMHYSIDPALTLNGYSVGWNTVLSESDKSFIGILYPRA